MRAVKLCCIIAVLALVATSAYAGTLKCRVLRSGVPQAGATVIINPGGATETTAADGTCAFTGLAAGAYSVEAAKDIGGILYGSVLDPFPVPAAGTIGKTLALVRAVYTYQYLPVTVGNAWQYKETTREYTAASAAPVVTTKTRREKIVGTMTTHTGDTANVSEVTWSGTTDSFKEYINSVRDGYIMYGVSNSGDDRTNNPPLHVPGLMPLGKLFKITTVIKHSDGTPDENLIMEVQLASFVAMTVPAGTFADCALVTGSQTTGTETQQFRGWMARNVGFVRMDERKPRKMTTRVLEEYKIVRPTLSPVRPIKPLTPIRRPVPKPSK